MDKRITVDTINDCDDCQTYQAENPHLVGACASVGIEHRKSPGQMLFAYLAAYHRAGHSESRAAR